MASSSSSSSSSSTDRPHWVPPPPEEPSNRFWLKAKENPLVPIGCLGTVLALTFGLVSFKRGNMAMSQNMMRFRVLAQGATVLALIGGIALGSNKASKQSKRS